MFTLLTLACTAYLAEPKAEPPAIPAAAPAAATIVSPALRQELSIAIGKKLRFFIPMVPPDRIDLDIVEQSFLRHIDTTKQPEELYEQYSREYAALNEIFKLYNKAADKENETVDAGFMLNHARKPGVATLDNGVQYIALGQNMGGSSRIENATGVRTSTLGGKAFRIYGGPVGGKGTGTPPLPACIRSYWLQIPDARTWVFHIPRMLLTDEEMRTFPYARIYVYIVTLQDDNTAWDYYAMRPLPAQTTTGETGITRSMVERHSAFTGMALALEYLRIQGLDRYSSAESNDIDRHTVIRTYLKLHEEVLPLEQPEQNLSGIFPQYLRILSARQAERDRLILQKKVAQGELHPLGHGIFYTNKADGNGSDTGFEEGRITGIASLEGRPRYFTGYPHPTSLPQGLDFIQDQIPPARAWNIYVPTSLLTRKEDLYPLTDRWGSIEDMQAEIGAWTSVIVYTLTVKQPARGRDTDIEDPE